MATTNLLQWNPTATNQETDAQYAADSQRTGGATDPSVFEAVLANKAFFQWSTYLTALFQAFANKGFTTSDSNINTLTATCAGFLTTADRINIVTSLGGPILSATQAGSSYGSGASSAAIMAYTQGGDVNYLFAGVNAASSVTFTVQANGAVRAVSLALTSALSAASATISGALSAASATISGALSAASATISGLLQSGSVQTGTATVTGQASANVLFAGGVSVVGNQGSYLMWNAVGGTGYMNFVNNRGAGGGGFTWYNLTGSQNPSTATPIAAMDGTGNLTAHGLTSTGNINTATLQINGTAPNGQVLTGNGSTYVPQALPTYALHYSTNDVTGARAFNATYQNTSGGLLMVSGYGRTSGSSIGSLQGLIGAGGPTTPCWGNTVAATVNNGACGFSFSVPPGWFYSVNANNLTNGQGSAVTGVASWVETAVTL